MPPDFASRCWASLKQALAQHGAEDFILLDSEAEKIIQGSFDAYTRVKPDSVNGIPPTFEQVSKYFTELGSTCDTQYFLDFYDARGWIIGASKARMKDWRAAARLWARNEGAKVKSVAGTASLFALQQQLTKVETELTEILHPGGSQFKVAPEGGRLTRYNILMSQRRALIAKIDAFAS